MKLTTENYYSLEADKYYLSVSQVQRGDACQDELINYLDGKIPKTETTALLVGTYFHAWNEGPEAIEKFITTHPQMISSRAPTKGQFKSDYQVVPKMIEIAKNDKLIMYSLNGRKGDNVVKEEIMTGEFGGYPFKIRIDSINHTRKYFTDLKSCKSLYDRHWDPKSQMYVSFVEHYGYVERMAVYQQIIYQNTGEWYEPYIAAITKEKDTKEQIKVPDKMLINFDTESLASKFADFLPKIEAVGELKKTREVKFKCGTCNWCKSHKQLDKPVHYSELI